MRFFLLSLIVSKVVLNVLKESLPKPRGDDQIAGLLSHTDIRKPDPNDTLNSSKYSISFIELL